VIEGGLGADEAADTSFLGSTLEDATASPATPGVFEVLPRLVDMFGGRAWIISKCGVETQLKTVAWLDHHDFYRRTGLPRSNVRFCRERADKATHCRELGVTHMIDDRLDVHAAIRDVVPHLYLFGPQDSEIPDWVVHVPDWPAAAKRIASDITG
jgi:hypothetical protein